MYLDSGSDITKHNKQRVNTVDRDIDIARHTHSSEYREKRLNVLLVQHTQHIKQGVNK